MASRRLWWNGLCSIVFGFLLAVALAACALAEPPAAPGTAAAATAEPLATPTPAPQTFRLTILHNNDGESRLIDAGRDREDFGGVARFATLVAKLRQEASDSGSVVLVLSAGDSYLAGRSSARAWRADRDLFTTSSRSISLATMQSCWATMNSILGRTYWRRRSAALHRLPPFSALTLTLPASRGSRSSWQRAASVTALFVRWAVCELASSAQPHRVFRFSPPRATYE